MLMCCPMALSSELSSSASTSASSAESIKEHVLNVDNIKDNWHRIGNRHHGRTHPIGLIAVIEMAGSSQELPNNLTREPGEVIGTWNQGLFYVEITAESGSILSGRQHP